MKRAILFFWAVALPPTFYGCASITAVALKPDGTKASDIGGIRYYLPKPYLLVAEIPVAKEDLPSVAVVTQSSGANGDAAKPVPDAEKKEEKQGPPPAATPSSNTSFLLASAQYAIKLIYLPDYSQPQALQARSGFFGSTTFKPNLQDGWMLTSFDSVTDNTKLADVLNSVSSLINPASSATVESAKTGSSDPKVLAAPGTPEMTRPPVLTPGLYEITFDGSGRPTGIRAVGLFCGAGLRSYPMPVPQNAPPGTSLTACP